MHLKPLMLECAHSDSLKNTRTPNQSVEYMSTDFEDIDEELNASNEEKIDWLQYAQGEQQALRPLDGKDYIALFVASLQTIFLPLIILIIVLLGFNFWLQIVAG